MRRIFSTEPRADECRHFSRERSLSKCNLAARAVRLKDGVPRVAQAVPGYLAMKRPRHFDRHALAIGGGPRTPTRSGTLRIDVSAARQVPGQARAYAEYRLFGALVAVSDVRSARVTLRPIRVGGRADDVACTIIVVHDDGRCHRVRATGAHNYQAINRATDRLTDHYQRPRHAISPRNALRRSYQRPCP